MQAIVESGTIIKNAYGGRRLFLTGLKTGKRAPTFACRQIQTSEINKWDWARSGWLNCQSTPISESQDETNPNAAGEKRGKLES